MEKPDPDEHGQHGRRPPGSGPSPGSERRPGSRPRDRKQGWRRDKGRRQRPGQQPRDRDEKPPPKGPQPPLPEPGERPARWWREPDDPVPPPEQPEDRSGWWRDSDGKHRGPDPAPDWPPPPRKGRADEAERKAAAARRRAAARSRMTGAGRALGRAAKVGAVGVASASGATAKFTGRAGRATGRRIRGLTSAQGAGESGLSRLIELGAVNAAADTAFAISLAGTIFFAEPGEARDRVALFLLLTMAPFALLAPLVGPFLDRFRHGRRWAIGATLGVRGFLVWSLASSIATNSAWLYPAALGCLVASKAYGVTRASAVPRLLPKDVSLVTANSRVSLAGVAGATVSAGISAGFAAIGPEWSLRWAALLYTIGMILAIMLPSRVDSPAGEEMIGEAGKDARRRAITREVTRGIRCNLGLRFLSGFLTMFLAFLLRDKPIAGISGVVLTGVVIAAAGLGNSIGTAVGSLLKARKPETIVLLVLVVDAVLAVTTAVFYGLIVLVLLGLVAGICSSMGKLSLDALIQRDVPETVRTSVFARSETVLQLAWVVGGMCGILMPLIPRLGFGFLAFVLIAVLVVVLRPRPAPPLPAPPVRTPTDRGTRSPRSADRDSVS